jgi:hypothetical protein
MNRSAAIAYHPQLGGLWFEHTSYVPEGSPTLRLVIFVPHDEQTAAKVAAAARSANEPRNGKRAAPKRARATN